ncbi:SprT family zinc-dependent metalloprotease [Alteromonas sp. KUL106]|uniref:SprT family zinc-dependent metalloprotease n=1 Tax=Alteromonas sp. KUL106 TaxID=2480799 RepID=UPI0022A7A5CE|nr:SprT family zinc-dependent metalloprotease [Alteromonas sp. KUL106]
MASHDLTQEQRRVITDAVFHCLQQAEEYFSRPFPYPTITFRRSGRNAGTAFLQQNRLNFHPILYKENTRAFLDDVVPHEVSHLLTWILFGKVQPHGKEWQSIMIHVFGRKPDPTHQFDIKGVTRSFHYRCECDSYALSTRRHNNILRGAQYKCRKCSAPLRMTKEAEAER